VLSAVVLANAGCGSTITRTVTANTNATAPLSQVVIPGQSTGAGTTSPVQLPLPFDSEENAFMGNPDPQHDGLNRTGCFADVPGFDRKSEEVCDCAYRRLRAEGYPALATGSDRLNARHGARHGPRVVQHRDHKVPG
jgi:hypothetical protein